MSETPQYKHSSTESEPGSRSEKANTSYEHFLNTNMIEQFNLANNLIEQYAIAEKDIETIYNIILIVSVVFIIRTFIKSS